MPPSSQSGASAALPTPARAGNPGDRAWGWGITIFGGALLVVAGLILYELGRVAEPAWKHLGLVKFLLSSDWDPVQEKFGALPFIYGTLVTSGLALVIALPVSVGLALFLSEMGPRALRVPVAYSIEVLAAIPSVIYGLWGLFVLVPWLRSSVQPFLQQTLGFLPIFKGPPIGLGYMAAGVILALMILPTIASVTIEVLKTVPPALKEGALALGATRWESIRISVLPYARPGIIGASLLGLGRALGETMAVTMVIGNTPQISLSLLSPAYTMPSVIANEFAEATSTLHSSALMEIGLILLVVTLIINVIARFLVWSVTKGQTKGVV